MTVRCQQPNEMNTRTVKRVVWKSHFLLYFHSAHFLLYYRMTLTQDGCLWSPIMKKKKNNFADFFKVTLIMHIEVYRPETWRCLPPRVCVKMSERGRRARKCIFPNVCVCLKRHTHTRALRRVSVCVCVTDSEVIPIKSKGGHFERERKSN